MSLNVELLRKVRDAIADEDNPVGFDMGEWGTRTACGTSCCIAGHTVRAGARNSWKWWHTYMVPRAATPGLDIDDLAVDVLHISPEEGAHLFRGHWFDGPRDALGDPDLGEITRAEAVAYLDLCLEAGEIVR
jgi:hypothetical protein